MKIKFIIEIGDYKKGSTLELPEKKAFQFIGAGFAVECTGKTKAELSDKVKAALVAADYEDMLDVLSASDDELLAIDGIGEATLKRIREIGEPVKDE